MTDTENLPALPEKWCWTTIGEIGDVITGGTPSKESPANYGNYIPFVKPPELNDCIINFAKDNLSEKGASLARILPPESVLVSCIGRLGKTGFNKIPVAFNQQINAIIFYDAVLPKYGFYYSQTIKNYLYPVASATTLQIVNKSKFQLIPFILPPLPEQHRIVQKIEELFTDLDAGVQELEKAKVQVKNYRRAVLNSAIKGKFTESWREKNQKTESADVLLDLISKEKRTKWEKAQLAKLEKTGKKLKDNIWKQKYKEPPSSDTINLPELPKSWSWASPEQVTSWEDPYALAIGPFGSNLKVSDYTSEGMPLIFVRNIRSGIFDGENTKYVSKTKAEELRPHWVNPLDILITKMGEPPGDACLYPIGNPTAIITADCIKFHLCSLLENPIYFVYAINSDIVKSQINSITMGVAQKKVSLERFKTIALPLPPAEEQKVIVSEIECRFSVIDQIEKTIDQSLAQAEKLRQSILKKAFEGKLVPQDPNDEPASVLLERIKEEKVRAESQKKPEKKTKVKAETIIEVSGNTKQAELF